VVLPFTGAEFPLNVGYPTFDLQGGCGPGTDPYRLRSSSSAARSAPRLAAPVCHGAGVRRRQAGPWTPCARQSLPGRQSASVVTQNIDNLHQTSGISAEHVIELHGNTTYALCLACGNATNALGQATIHDGRREVPDCTDCGGLIKSATVSFGQAMPKPAMRRAEELTLACDLFLRWIFAGVWPAAGFPRLAKRNGARLVIINREATEFDEIADLVIRDDIGTVLSPSFSTDSGKSKRCSQGFT